MLLAIAPTLPPSSGSATTHLGPQPDVRDIIGNPLREVATTPMRGGSSTFKPGMSIYQYELIRELGSGGMGTVYLARDTRLGRRVAIKLLRQSAYFLNKRFMLEAQATARCNHENIVVIHEIGEYRSHPYMVLEYLEGQTLRQWLREHAASASSSGQPAAVPPSRAAALMLPVVRALVYAHARGIVHRDLKPENVMLTRSGTIKVLDFGIAKLLSAPMHDEEGSDGVTDGAVDASSGRMPGPAAARSSALIGTLPYMSPEQMNAGVIDHRSDVWTAGIMLFELVTGRHPMSPSSTGDLFRIADLDEPMPAVGEVMPDLGPEMGPLAGIIDRCLLKHPEHRTPSARVLLAELEALATGRRSVLVGDDGNPFAGLAAFQEADGDSRSRGRAVAAGLVMAVAVGVGLAMQWQPPPVWGPPLSELGGVVVIGGQFDNGGRDAWQHLCTVLRDLGEQAVRCIAPPAPPDYALIDAAREARASLVITVEAGPVARVLPVPGRDGEPLLQGLPAVSIARPETRSALAQIAYVLAQGPRYAPSKVAALLPIEPDRAMPWRVTALAALARVWTEMPWNSQERGTLSEIAQRCRGEPASLADAHCALVHYVLYAEVVPEDPDAEARLDELVSQGPRGIADTATLLLLSRRCIEDPARTRRELLELAARAQGCQRWYLMTPATCVLVASREGADGADNAAIRALAEPDAHAGEACPDDLRAGAYYDRAHWLAETWNASTRMEWEQAVASYELAYRLDPSADHAQGLAEALLFLRRLVPELADEITRSATEVLDRAAVDEPTAVFLAWLAGGALDASGLARLCAIYRELSPGEVAVPYVSHRLACPGGEGDDSPGCRAYRLLSAPRPVADGSEPEESVCAVSDKALSRKSE